MELPFEDEPEITGRSEVVWKLLTPGHIRTKKRMPTIEETPTTQAVAIIDKFLGDIAGRALVSSDEVRDVMLDLRIVLSFN